jgi:hypothetical protein
VAEGESVVLSAVLDHWGAGALNVRQAQPALAD